MVMFYFDSFLIYSDEIRLLSYSTEVITEVNNAIVPLEILYSIYKCVACGIYFLMRTLHSQNRLLSNSK